MSLPTAPSEGADRANQPTGRPGDRRGAAIEPARPRPGAPRPDGAPLVLLVEDDAPTRAAVARSLVAHGYDVHEAPDAATAIR